jgi:hypothetical protein
MVVQRTMGKNQEANRAKASYGSCKRGMESILRDIASNSAYKTGNKRYEVRKGTASMGSNRG